MSTTSAALAAVTGPPAPPRLLNRPRPLRPSELSRRSRPLRPLRPLRARRPLAGQTILVTRPLGQQRQAQRALEALGACTVHVPTLRVVPLDAQLPAPEHAPRCVAAVFVSANAVRCGMGALKRRWNPLPNCYAVGKATQRALAECGVDALAPTDGDGAAALLRRPEFAAPIDGDVLLLRGAHGLAALGDSLAARGATVHSCALYRRARCATHRRRLRRRIEARLAPRDRRDQPVRSRELAGAGRKSPGAARRGPVRSRRPAGRTRPAAGLS